MYTCVGSLLVTFRLAVLYCTVLLATVTGVPADLLPPVDCVLVLPPVLVLPDEPPVGLLEPEELDDELLPDDPDEPEEPPEPPEPPLLGVVQFGGVPVWPAGQVGVVKLIVAEELVNGTAFAVPSSRADTLLNVTLVLPLPTRAFSVTFTTRESPVAPGGVLALPTETLPLLTDWIA